MYLCEGGIAPPYKKGRSILLIKINILSVYARIIKYFVFFYIRSQLYFFL